MWQMFPAEVKSAATYNFHLPYFQFPENLGQMEMCVAVPEAIPESAFNNLRNKKRKFSMLYEYVNCWSSGSFKVLSYDSFNSHYVKTLELTNFATIQRLCRVKAYGRRLPSMS